MYSSAKHILATLALSVNILTGQPDLAQRPLDADMKFEHFGSESGLSQSSGIAIAQDQRGFLWIGTQSGLNRYDGRKFVSFRHDPTDSTTLSDSYINSLLVCRDGTLLVGTNTGGLNKYSAASMSFQRYFPPEQLVERNSLGGLYDLAEDDDGRVYTLYNRGGVFEFDHRVGTYSRITEDQRLSGSDTRTYLFYQDARKDIWIAAESILYRFRTSRSNQGVDELQSFAWHDVSENKNHILHGSVVIEDSSNSLLWIGTDRQGLFKISVDSLDTGRAIPFSGLDSESSTLLRQSFVSQLHFDQYGRLWIGTSLGLFVLTPGTEHLVHLPYLGDERSTSSIRALFEDKSGVLWIGTEGHGLKKYVPTQRNFKVFQHDQDNPQNGLRHDDITSVYVAPIHQDVWIGSRGGGVHRFDPRSEQWEHFEHAPADPNSLLHNHIRGICEDQRDEGNTVWIGSWAPTGGINLYNRGYRSFQHLVHDEGDPGTIADNQVRKIYQDRSNGIWVGATEGGLSRLVSDSIGAHTFENYTAGESDSFSLSNDDVFDIYEDRFGIVWIATFAGGLNRLDPNSGRIKSYQNDPENPGSLSHNRVWTVTESRSGELWIGSSGGISQFDRESELFINYNEDNGLCNNSVFGILEDESGLLWLSTANGLGTFDPATTSFASFDISHGLPSNEFNHGTVAKTSDGEFYMGTIRGLIRFRPDQVKKNTYIPNIAFTSFNLFENPVQLDTAISEVQRIELAHHENFISFEFASLDFQSPQRNQYAYKVDGLHDEWIHCGTRNSAGLGGISHGSYTLRVKGSNNDGVWNDQGVSLKLVIHPPWYQTNWAYILYLLWATALVWGGRWVVTNWRSIISLRARKISHFKLLEKIGAGGMGEVYRALDTNTQQVCAIKLLNPDLIGDESNRKRLANEGRLLTSFTHPHIVRVYEVGELADEGYIAMEFLSGGTLRTYLHEKHPLSLQEVTRILVQLASGLGEIHEKGIIHRDLKTANIMLDENNDIRIMDFGLSKSPLVTTMTSIGTVLGTLGYVAPEQITGSGVGPHTDVFSFGVIVYELLTGKLPFSGENEMALIHSIFNHAPPPLAETRSELPDGWQQLVNSCLEKDYEERIGSVAELKRMLK